MKELLVTADFFATSDHPVLIYGETGTGKELIARRLHQLSSRSNGKLVSVNITTIPETMFEREMFGHVQGSFTGADHPGIGYVAAAAGGTLFLDEIGELPITMQPKLLRLLQEGTYQALGDPLERVSDIRIIAATNANLESLVSKGKFRADLYYRLKGLELDLPPLRHRRGDVSLLLQYFISQAAGSTTKLGDYFDQISLEFLEQYSWPGNVRELYCLAQRASLEFRSKGKIELKFSGMENETFFLRSPSDCTPQVLAMEASSGVSCSFKKPVLNSPTLLRTLEECGGNRVKAARRLGISRSTLYRKLNKFGLD